MQRLLIYGARGRLGSRLAQACVAAGLEPVLAGRDGGGLGTLARSLGLAHRVFSLEDPTWVRAGLAGIGVVLNAAAPYEHTALPLAEACLFARSHYVDLCGEWDVLARVQSLGPIARERGVALLPGAGFDIGALDALSARLLSRLPRASHLEVAVADPMGVSPGGLPAVARALHGGGRVRSAGRLKAVPLGSPKRVVDFGLGPVACGAVPLGILASPRSANVISYVPVRPLARLALRASRPFAWALGGPAVQQHLVGRLRRAHPEAHVLLWGEARREEVESVSARVSLPGPLEMTEAIALGVASRLVDDGGPSGCLTPAAAWGPDWILALEGVAVDERPVRAIERSELGSAGA